MPGADLRRVAPGIGVVQLLVCRRRHRACCGGEPGETVEGGKVDVTTEMHKVKVSSSSEPMFLRDSASLNLRNYQHRSQKTTVKKYFLKKPSWSTACGKRHPMRTTHMLQKRAPLCRGCAAEQERGVNPVVLRTPSRSQITQIVTLRLFYGCSYMHHLSGNNRRDSHFMGS